MNLFPPQCLRGKFVHADFLGRIVYAYAPVCGSAFKQALDDLLAADQNQINAVGCLQKVEGRGNNNLRPVIATHDIQSDGNTLLFGHHARDLGGFFRA